ncbi:polysaccharide biosynthesis protein [Mechercharimyces sp. CAU 1602]|uniref:putative polysaccharide biosynthesis protein n=1 Tax=Mechercharimyces sp. CAU 1602 TaxID=2973933 RepID=UPI002161F44D|nr:polysaccharide biosynthesis protein [Mechercharimyces sp. CAU 1602]MCS1351403.1 polysaccharide biosynthesis protein [Mechercharimyces sp. CAU 1602]
MNKKNTLIRGTLILSAATFISKILGTLFTIPLQNIAGDEVMGIYMEAFPYYSILLMIAIAGIPITVSKFVAERLSLGDKQGAQLVLRTGLIILSFTGFIGFCLLYLSSGWISNVMIGNANAEPSIKALAFALLIVPIMAVIRGYFQGHQQMIPTALSQVIEQLLRVTTALILIYWLVIANYPDSWVAAGATMGASVGALAGLVVMLFFRSRDREESSKHPATATSTNGRESFFSLSKKILLYAIPISLGTMVMPLINLLDTTTIPRLLEESLHYTQSEATALFGIYSRGTPYASLIATFSTALGLALIPAISAHTAKAEWAAIQHKIKQAWFMTFLVSLPACVGLIVLARPVNIMMYAHSDHEGVSALAALSAGTWVIALFGIAALFNSLTVSSSGILQGMGFNRLPVRHLMIGAVVKVIGNIILVPLYGLKGGAISLVIAYIVVCVLNVWMVTRKANISFPFAMALKPLLSALLMGVTLYLILGGIEWLFAVETFARISYMWISISLTIIGIGIYLIALLLSGAMGERELLMLPKGAKLVKLFTRLHLLRT